MLMEIQKSNEFPWFSRFQNFINFQKLFFGKNEKNLFFISFHGVFLVFFLRRFFIFMNWRKIFLSFFNWGIFDRQSKFFRGARRKFREIFSFRFFIFFQLLNFFFQFANFFLFRVQNCGKLKKKKKICKILAFLSTFHFSNLFVNFRFPFFFLLHKFLQCLKNEFFANKNQEKNFPMVL